MDSPPPRDAGEPQESPGGQEDLTVGALQRYGAAPGVVRPGWMLARARHVYDLGAAQLPLLADVLRRWVPTSTSFPGGPLVTYARPQAEPAIRDAPIFAPAETRPPPAAGHHAEAGRMRATKPVGVGAHPPRRPEPASLPPATQRSPSSEAPGSVSATGAPRAAEIPHERRGGPGHTVQRTATSGGRLSPSVETGPPADSAAEQRATAADQRPPRRAVGPPMPLKAGASLAQLTPSGGAQSRKGGAVEPTLPVRAAVLAPTSGDPPRSVGDQAGTVAQVALVPVHEHRSDQTTLVRGSTPGTLRPDPGHPAASAPVISTPPRSDRGRGGDVPGRALQRSELRRSAPAAPRPDEEPVSAPGAPLVFAPVTGDRTRGGDQSGGALHRVESGTEPIGGGSDVALAVTRTVAQAARARSDRLFGARALEALAPQPLGREASGQVLQLNAGRRVSVHGAAATGGAVAAPDMILRTASPAPRRETSAHLPEAAIASHHGIVARDTATRAGSPGEGTPGGSPEPVPPLVAAAAAASPHELDVVRLAEQVSRILARRLAVERERSGLGRWY